MSGTITITGEGNNDAAKQPDEREKGVIFKSCVPFTICISETNNTRIDSAKDIDAVSYNLIECCNNYSKNMANSESF